MFLYTYRFSHLKNRKTKRKPRSCKFPKPLQTPLDCPHKIDTVHHKFKIYCSPLLRTLQTIYPFAEMNNTQINLEESLYEHISQGTSHYASLNRLPKIDTHDDYNDSDLML